MKISQFIKLEKNTSTPVYQQIVNSLFISFETGRLKAGDRLPGLRVLSEQTGVAVNTISKALQILVEHGALEAENRSGYRVKSRPPAASSRYEKRGASATKQEVHRVVDKMDPGLFPGAFCK